MLSNARVGALACTDAWIEVMSRLASTERRVAAILIADIVGYSRLMEAHEEYTHTWQQLLRATVLDPGIAAHAGRVVKNTGDGFIALFDTARDATQAAVTLQRALAAQTAAQPIEQRISFRMAVNLASVIIEQDDVYGDGVNVAARLQTYAEPGGIVVAGAVMEQMGNGLDIDTIDLGDLHLRNLSRPVRVFALRNQTAPARLIGDDRAGAEARPSIAVLPFRMRPTDPAESYFVNGMIDEIIHGLAAFKELFVISRGSVPGHGGGTIDVRAVAAKLGVRYVLYGSVRRSAGRIIIVTELSDAETSTVIRADQYEGNLTDLFELQGQIAVNVVKTIAPHVQERELVRAMRKQPLNLTSYDFVLQALDVLYRMDYESFSRARGLLQQAMAHDPDYAPAYSYTALWHIFRIGEMGSSDPEADGVAAARYAAEALARDQDDALALAISGHVQSYSFRKYDEAISLFGKAIAASPNSAMAWSLSSATHGFVGHGSLAVKHGEQGVRLSPLDARLFWHEGLLGQAHYVDGNYDEALEWVRSALARNASIRYTYRTLIATLVALGRHEEATEAARMFLELQPDFRLGPYARRCPFTPPILDVWIAALHTAGLPV